jgi:hypothetical protein
MRHISPGRVCTSKASHFHRTEEYSTKKPVLGTTNMRVGVKVA